MQMDIENSKRQAFLDTYIDCLTMSETIEIVEASIRNRKPLHHISMNANKVVLLEEDATLKKIVNEAGLITADGSSILMAGKVLGLTITERVTGIDLFIDLLSVCQEKGYRPFFLGAKEEVLNEMIARIVKDYPGIDIAGSHHGYFNELENEAVVSQINDSQADMLFVAFSSPQKEYWVYKNKKQLTPAFIMGVGGSFDVLAGKTKRAPAIWQKYGFEWLYRFIQEPIRMFGRYVIGNARFMGIIGKKKLARHK